MTTIITLDGGFGRIITAIPAFLKYYKNQSYSKFSSSYTITPSERPIHRLEVLVEYLYAQSKTF
jgi:hypothetical protein